MKIYIMVDAEGISGIHTPDQVIQDSRRFQEGRELLTQDINVCVEACKEAGADEVYVRDCHGGSYMAIYEKLTPSADYYICGRTGDARYLDADGFDGVILLGYHAMAGTPGAVLEHSMSSKSIQNYWINGEKVGETAMDAAGFGFHGVPVIMVSGDDKVCAEASALLPWIVPCEVKKGVTWGGAMLPPLPRAHEEIRRCTRKAIENIGSMKPYTPQVPMTLRVELVERGILPSPLGKPGIKIIDGRTYEITGNTMEELIYTHG